MCLKEIDWLTTINNREISFVLLSTLSILSCIRDNVDVNGGRCNSNSSYSVLT